MSPSPLYAEISYCPSFRCLSIYSGMVVSVTGSAFFLIPLKTARAGIADVVVFTISTNLLLL